MANTYVALATVTVGSGGAANIEFTSIPGTYTDLLVKLSARTDRNTGTAASVYIGFNSDTSSIYSVRNLSGDATTVSSDSSSSVAPSSAGSLFTSQATDVTSTFGNAEIYIPNYAGSANKSVNVDSVQEDNATISYVRLAAYLWASSSAITSIQLTTNSTFNFVQYSTATLYGIKNS